MAGTDVRKFTLSGRERVERALNHVEPDRVPLSLTITKVPYERLREHLGLPPDNDLHVNFFGEVNPKPDLLSALGVDIIWISLHKPDKNITKSPSDTGIVYDEWGVGRRRVDLSSGAYYYDVVDPPLKDARPADLADYPWPDPYDPGRSRGLGDDTQAIYRDTDFAIMGRFGGPILEMAGYLRGWEQWLVDLAADPDFARALLNKICDIQIALDRQGLEVTGPYLSIFKVSGEDLGMQDRMIFSMKTWNEIVKPVLHRRWLAARQTLDRIAPQVKIMLHSDGAFQPLIADLIDMGIDLLDPIQHFCKGMDVYELKAAFGERLSFHGAIDSQYVLPSSDARQIEKEVVRCIDGLGHGGGYILGPCHNVQADVPAVNIAVMFEQAREYGRYPLPKRAPIPPLSIS
jgi:uroporphyrinogen decarboxylase